MPAQPITRGRVAKLEEMGEEAVFHKYVEVGTVTGLMQELFEPHGKDAKQVGADAFYKWLDNAPGRRERWQEFKRMRGHMDADEAYKIAMAATGENVRESKLKVDTLKWRAGILNRDEYGDKTKHEVEHSIGSQWLDALRQAEEQREVPEADVEYIEGEVVEDDEAAD